MEDDWDNNCFVNSAFDEAKYDRPSVFSPRQHKSKWLENQISCTFLVYGARCVRMGWWGCVGDVWGFVARLRR